LSAFDRSGAEALNPPSFAKSHSQQNRPQSVRKSTVVNLSLANCSKSRGDGRLIESATVLLPPVRSKA